MNEVEQTPNGGFTPPNYTQAPNALFDSLMRDMSESELKVVLCAVRKILGWHKQRDPISLSQFQEMTGLSRPAVVEGIEQAIARGLLRRAGEGARKVTVYELCIGEDPTGKENSLVKNVNQSKSLTSTGKKSLPVLVKNSNPQKKKKEIESKKRIDSIDPDLEHNDLTHTSNENDKAFGRVFAEYEQVLGGTLNPADESLITELLNRFEQRAEDALLVLLKGTKGARKRTPYWNKGLSTMRQQLEAPDVPRGANPSPRRNNGKPKGSSDDQWFRDHLNE